MQTIALTINLRKNLLKLHVKRRRKRAPGLVKEAVARFTKSDIDTIRLHRDLNTFIERQLNGGSSLISRIKVSVEKSEGKVEVKLPSTKTESKTEPKEKKAVAAAAKKMAPAVKAAMEATSSPIIMTDAPKAAAKTKKTEAKDAQQKEA